MGDINFDQEATADIRVRKDNAAAEEERVRIKHSAQAATDSAPTAKASRFTFSGPAASDQIVGVLVEIEAEPDPEPEPEPAPKDNSKK